MRNSLRYALLLMLGVLMLAGVAAAQMPTSVLVVNVGTDIVRSGLSLTRFGVAEMGDQYTVGGTFLAKGGKLPKQVVLHMVTSSGKNISRTGQLQGAPMGMYGFLVFLPKDEGQLKMVTIMTR